MSGLDDSLSDVGGKKKYPFELEKAIHNVMFIQHHMQRQDEFNAVSGSQTLHVLSSLPAATCKVLNAFTRLFIGLIFW